MHRYILKRILLLIPIIIGVSFLVFFMMDLAPGDVLDSIGGEDMSEEDYMRMREELNLDKSVFIRYGIYMSNLLQGKMGWSITQQADIWALYKQRFPNTLKLALGSVIVCVVLSLPLGIVAAVKHGSLIDNGASALSILGLSIPNFWLGMLLLIVFGLKLKLFPTSGASEGIKSLILPSFTVGTGMMATMARTTRSSMLDVLRQDYLRTARAKGVPNRKVIWRDALRNALIPIITVFGTQLGACFGGSMVTENVFTYPGIGQMLVSGIKGQDVALVCGFIIATVSMISVVQLFVDILYAFADPRLRAQYSSAGKRRAKKAGAAA